MTTPAPIPPVLAEETHLDASGVARVVEQAFGPGRYAKTAERLRETNAPLAGFVMRAEGAVVGSVRLWPVRIGPRRAGFLGPIAVDPVWREAGAGAELVQAVITRARDLDLAGVLLVGDTPYFGRFGFVEAPGLVLPGPVDPRRILWLGFQDAKVEGAVMRG